jgi:hypothetical protein
LSLIEDGQLTVVPLLIFVRKLGLAERFQTLHFWRELNAAASQINFTSPQQGLNRIEVSMADPLSGVASVAGLASLAIHLSQLSFQYVSSLKGSSKAWSSYIQELSTLTSVLLKLQQACDSAGAQDFLHILPAPGLSSHSIRECHNELDSLKSTLSEKLQRRGLRGKLEMLSWPFSEPDTQVKVSMLHRFSSLFGSSLVADNL